MGGGKKMKNEKYIFSLNSALPTAENRPLYDAISAVSFSSETSLSSLTAVRFP